MKHYNLLLALFISILAVNIYAQNYGLDSADPSVFTRYKVPDTDLRSLWFNTSLNFSSNKQSYTTGFNTNSDYNSNFTYNLSPNYYYLQESDNRYLNFNANIGGGYSRWYSENRNNNSSYINTSKQNEYSTSIYLNLTDNNYKNNGDVFYSIASRILVNMSDTKRDNNNYGISSASYMGSKSQNYNFSFGIGIGKLRNVTPVVSAIRLQERLKQVNLLNTNLTDKTIEDLAQQFSRQNYYSQVYVRPDKYFWQGIEKILTDDGISLSGLNMYADEYLRETTKEIRFLRQEGFMSGINFQLNYQNYYSVVSGGQSLTEQLFTLGNAYLTYSHQLNLNSQISFNVSISGGPNLLAKPSVRQQYSLGANAGYNYELTDRLVTSLNNSFGLIFQNGNYRNKYLTNDLQLSLNYFMEDNLSLNASYEWSYSDARTFTTTVLSNRSINTINAGFTFYIDRGMLIR